MTTEENALYELVVELVYALDSLVRHPELAEHYRPTVARSKATLLTIRPDLAARLYD